MPRQAVDVEMERPSHDDQSYTVSMCMQYSRLTALDIKMARLAHVDMAGAGAGAGAACLCQHTKHTSYQGRLLRYLGGGYGS